MRNPLRSDRISNARVQSSQVTDVRLWNPGEEQPSDKQQAEWRIKTYYASTMQGAVSEARQELGEDAIIMSSRSTPQSRRHLGEYEIVVGVRPCTFATAAPVQHAPRETTSEAGLPVPPDMVAQRPWSGLATDVAAMRTQLFAIQELLQQRGLGTELPRMPGAKEWNTRLVSVGIPENASLEILREASECFGNFESCPVPSYAAIADVLKRRFHVNPTLGSGSAEAKAVVLVGPPGCGKTTSLIKLAIREGMLMQIPTTLLSLDRDRIAAMQQMESYASILGLEFRQMDSVNALNAFLEKQNNKSLVLVDTNGISSSDLDEGRELSEFLQSHPNVDTHLVLPANLRDSDLSRIIDRFEILSPKKLLFTMIDETEAYGVLIRESSRTGKPISFLSKGRQIPEDIERATHEGIARLVLKGRRRQTSGQPQ